VPHAREARRDRERLADLATGNLEALVELYDRHAASLYRHGLVLCRQSADAEDLVQTVFIKLATTGADLLGVRDAASYLHRILHTGWLDRQRRDATGARVIGEVGYTSARFAMPHVAREDAIDIARALDALPVAEREVVMLHVTEGFSFREIGRMTGVSLFTAAGRYRQGMTRLRKSFGV